MLPLLQKIQVSDADIMNDIFYCDGSLRNIYVCGTVTDDWQKLIDFLHSKKYKFTYQPEGSEKPLPSKFNEIQKYMGETAQLLSVYVESIILNCHFFWTEEIEFDLLPNEVNTQEKAEAVLKFIVEIGQLIDKEIILTPENGLAHVLIRYKPQAKEIEYIQS